MSPSDAIGVGFIGYGWMGRTHAHALHAINHIAPLQRPIRLVSMAGRDEGRVREAAGRLGFERSTTRWEEVVEDPEVEVVAVLTATHAHAAPSLAALEAGKAVLCEKPLGSDAVECERMAAAAASAQSTSACGFNYRFVPAVRLAREVIASGALGEPRHYRAVYLQDWAASPELPGSWRFTALGNGNGAVGDYSHIVDLLRYLVGEPTSTIAQAGRLIPERPGPDGTGRVSVEVEDWYGASLWVEGGCTATLEASRCATGWKGRQRIEVNGSEGSLWWDMEDLNRLHVFRYDDARGGLGGFRDVLVTEPEHPFMEQWWAPGHILGWEHTFVHQWSEFLGAYLRDEAVGEHQASFQDGHRAALVCDAILTSARRGRRVALGEAEQEASGSQTKSPPDRIGTPR